MKIHYVLKPAHRDGVQSILIPAKSSYNNYNTDHTSVEAMWDRITPTNGKDVATWERITDRNTMEKMLLRWQQLHFLQANETPLAQPAWRTKLDDESFQQNVIDGTYEPPDDLEQEVKELFQYMKRSEGVSDLPFTSTVDDFKSFIKNSNVKTSVSPSGRSYAHYKTLIKGPPVYINTIHVIIEICAKHQMISNRWKRTITTLIEKEPGSPFIHSMRAIHIIEVEVQFLVKHHYVHQMMGMAEKSNLITDEQYGGRREMQSQSAVINKILYHNISRQMLMTSAYMDDDARACYDRILTSLSGLEGRKWGASYDLSSFTTKFIESQEFAIRTGHGISDDVYTYDNTNRIQGSGQGIGWAGPRWLNASDTCSKIMESRCAGMKFQDSAHTITIQKRGDFFADDTATGVTSNTLHPNKNILQQLAHDEQTHANILFAMGHKLALDKCTYYILTFIRDGIHHRCCLIHEYPGELNLKETFTSSPITVKRLQPFTAHRTLGCFIAIDGNQRRQFRELTSKIDTWNRKVATSFLVAEARLVSYNAYIKKSVQYVAPTHSFDQKQCHELDKKITPVLFNAHGVQRNCSKCILYGPTIYGGYGYYDNWHLKGIEKLKFLLMHYCRHDVTGKLYKICMRWTQLELGFQNPFYTYKYSTCKDYVTSTIITDLWDYLSLCNASLIEHAPWTYTPPRTNDFFSMKQYTTVQFLPNTNKYSTR